MTISSKSFSFLDFEPIQTLSHKLEHWESIIVDSCSCHLLHFFYYNFWQLHLGGQGTGVLHEEATEKEREGCKWCYCLRVVTHHQKFYMRLPLLLLSIEWDLRTSFSYY